MPNFAKYRSPIAIFLWLIGGLILTVQLGDWLLPPKRQQAIQKEGVAGYDFRTLSFEQFQQARIQIRNEQRTTPEPSDIAADPSSIQKQATIRQRWESAKRLNQIVHQAIRHDDTVRIRPGENWIQWLAGFFYPPLQWPQLPDQILERQAGICSDACLALQLLLQENQIPSRVVGLSGHVVLEVQIADQWRLLDPDFGVESDSSVRELSDAAANGRKGWRDIEETLKGRAYSTAQIQNYRDVLASTEDNLNSPTNQPLNPRLYQFALVTGWLSRFSSLTLFVVGALLIWPQLLRRPAVQPTSEPTSNT